jgi:hypothetical protein
VQFDDVPVAMAGTPVDETGAILFRPAFAEDTLRVRVWGAHVDGPKWRQENGFYLSSREQLKGLIDELQGIYYGWPGDYR